MTMSSLAQTILLDDRGRPYGCDWWLPSRAKCDLPTTIEALDGYGSPLRFCRRHWRLISKPDYAPLMYPGPLREVPR